VADAADPSFGLTDTVVAPVFAWLTAVDRLFPATSFAMTFLVLLDPFDTAFGRSATPVIPPSNGACHVAQSEIT
jgi:hypothetical protein